MNLGLIPMVMKAMTCYPASDPLLDQPTHLRQLPMSAGGPIRLVPQGGLAVVPEADCIALQTLPPLPPKRDFLRWRR